MFTTPTKKRAKTKRLFKIRLELKKKKKKKKRRRRHKNAGAVNGTSKSSRIVERAGDRGFKFNRKALNATKFKEHNQKKSEVNAMLVPPES